MPERLIDLKGELLWREWIEENRAFVEAFKELKESLNACETPLPNRD